MMGALLIFHAIVCALLIGAILLQTGRGASTGAAFGGGGTGTFFGPSGEISFLGKAIVVLFVIFICRKSSWAAPTVPPGLSIRTTTAFIRSFSTKLTRCRMVFSGLAITPFSSIMPIASLTPKRLTPCDGVKIRAIKKVIPAKKSIVTTPSMKKPVRTGCLCRNNLFEDIAGGENYLLSSSST